jgi:hypothetical protein
MNLLFTKPKPMTEEVTTPEVETTEEVVETTEETAAE